jgi:pyrroloquinoline quinone (PQQ) biosynthesis protein C
MDELTFLTEHAEVDVGHTALNERMMKQVLRTRPEDGRRLAAFGARGLDCYLRLLGDCLRASQDALAVIGAAA